MRNELIIDYCPRPAFPPLPETAYMSRSVTDDRIKLIANAIQRAVASWSQKETATIERTKPTLARIHV
jgi:hypothetical protein